MIRLQLPAGVVALAVSLVSVIAAVEAPGARAQQSAAQTEPQHTQPPADEIVPLFVAKAVVQPLPPAIDGDQSGSGSAATLRELVAAMPGDEPLDEQLQCLAGAVYFEARGEPLTGQLAVAEVVVSRASSRKFPASYCGVVRQPSQFSFVKRGRMPSIATGSPAWQRAKAIAQIAHRGLWDSQAEGALYFHARSVAPGWSNRRQAMARISGHVFYK